MAAHSDVWTYQFSNGDLDDLEAALQSFRRSGLPLTQVSRSSFPLSALGGTLDGMLRDLLHGRGFVLLRGLDIGGRPMADIVALNLGISARFGAPRPQNGRGDLVGHVRDLGGDPADPSVRIYQTNCRQTYHTDSADIVGLLCVRNAYRGGASSIVSSHTIYNEIMARRPDLLPILFDPFPTDRRGDIPEGMLPYFSMPIFHWFEGELSAIYSRTYILTSQRLAEAPPLSPEQREAVELVHALADDPQLHLKMDFEPGDIQLLHNHQVLHDRTEFVDWPEPRRKRHMLRIWLCPANGRPLPDVYAQRYGSTTVGDRGGIFVPNGKVAIRLE